jgi:hypothetical protein
MRKACLPLLALIIALSTSGCLSSKVDKKMKSWMDHHYSDLLMQWGPPQHVYSDGKGGRILMYTAERQYTTPGQATTNANINVNAYDDMIWGSVSSTMTYRPPETYGYTAYRMFAINKDGIIYRWAWKGL